MRSLILAFCFAVVSCGEPSTPPDPSKSPPPTRDVVPTIDRDSIEMTGPGSYRVAVRIVDSLGRLVEVGDDLDKSLKATGPLVASWDPNNRRTHRNLVIDASTAGAGEVVVTVEGRTDTVHVRAVAVSFREIAVAEGFACAIDIDERAWCWGDNHTGQLGVDLPSDCNGASCQYGGGDRAISPVPVKTAARFRQIAVGGLSVSIPFANKAGVSGRACGIDTSNALFCWGGSGDPTVKAMIAGSHWNAVAVSSAFARSCGLMTTGRAHCMEINEQITPVGGELSYVSLSVANSHSCGVASNGELYCWGQNSRGELGLGTVDATTHESPEPVSAPVKFSAVAVGTNSTCALSTEGAIYCWGVGYASTGESPPPACGPSLCQSSPRLVTSGPFVAMSRAQTATTLCGLTGAGQVNCWSAYNEPSTPVPVVEPLRSISVGKSDLNGYFPANACGVSSTDSAWCWNSGGIWKVGK